MSQSRRKTRGRYCAVICCHNNQGTLVKWRNSVCEIHDQVHKDCPCLEPFRFFNFPKGEEIRRNWVKALNRKDYIPTRDSVVCSEHFIDGESPKTRIPELHLGYTKKVVCQRRVIKKFELFAKRQVRTSKCTSTQSVSDQNAVEVESDGQHVENEYNEDNGCTPIDLSMQLSSTVSCEAVFRKDQQTQTTDCKPFPYDDHNYCKEESRLPKETKDAVIQTERFSGSTLFLNNTDAIFYTGLTVSVFNAVVSCLSPLAKTTFQISVAEQLFLVFMRLRLALTLGDLSRRFMISKSTASSVFNCWIKLMADNLRKLIIWLPRESIIANLPPVFAESFPRTTCILDCTEIFTERPINLKARACTWSNYKSHNTLKFLVSISPHGYIMFISALYGGRASDKFICTDSGIFNYLLPGDEVMADRGLLISDELAAIRVSLNVPPYLKDRDQMTQEETIATRRCASLRIHVERAIARIKSYRILKGVSPAAIRRNMDDIVTVCAALCNLKSDLIKNLDL